MSDFSQQEYFRHQFEQELKDYSDYRRKHSVVGIILSIITLIVFYFILNWVADLILNDGEIEAPFDLLIRYSPALVILITFLAGILPMIVNRFKIRRKYRWTKDRRNFLEQAIRAMPISTASMSVKPEKGHSAVPLVILIIIAGLVLTNEYTAFKPIDFLKEPLRSIFSLTASGSVPAVSGSYQCHFEEKDLGGGVMRTDQTWTYTFHEDGTYSTALNGFRQYSGTWSQTNAILTIKVPAIANISAAYTTQATVSRDGKAFTADDNKFVKVG